MAQSSEPNDYSAPLTAAEAFQAMRHFLEAFGKRYAQPPEAIVHLLGDIDCSLTLDGGPADPAQWEDWLRAIEKAKE